MTASVVRPDVARFVQDVRAALGDLAPDEVDDLTDGLAADVTDALGDGDISTLGDPSAYAAELRSAAGLPPRATEGSRPVEPPPHRRLLDGVSGWLDRQAWWPATRDFLVVLRPVWWVIRGWAVFQLVFAQGPLLDLGRVLTRDPLALLVLLALVVASVQVGRRSDRFDKPLRSVVLVFNTFVVLCILGSALAGSGDSEPDVAPVGMPTVSGLWANGSPVRDVFAYDGQGRLVPVVQLYDQDGRPIELAEEVRMSSDDQGRTVEAAPAVNADGRRLWNVFPIRQQLVTEVTEDGQVRPTPRPIATAPPFRSVAPIAGPSPTSSSSPTPSPTASPTPSPTPSPTASRSAGR